MLTPPLKEHFEKSGRNLIMIVGIEAHVCVLQTALELLEKGNDVHIIGKSLLLIIISIILV
jgi:isochorismate hydrolase